MRLFAVSTMATVMATAMATVLIAGTAGAQTAIQAGEWEVTEKTTMEGVQAMPPTSRKVCLKANEAQLERLLFPSPDEIAQHGCKFDGGAKTAGTLKASLSCPPAGDMPGVDATAEVTYTQTSYEGLGQLTAKDKSGTSLKGSSVLSGKRVGDCP